MDKQIASSEANNTIDVSKVETANSDSQLTEFEDISFHESQHHTSGSGCMKDQISEDTLDRC